MVAATKISHYLDTDCFPATKEECIRMASERGAPNDVIAALDRLPEGVYETVDEIWAIVDAEAA